MLNKQIYNKNVKIALIHRCGAKGCCLTIYNVS